MKISVTWGLSLPGGSNRRGAAWAAAASLAIGFGVALLFAETAWAGCTPAAGNNVTATCTGATSNQAGGAPGTSAGSNGYGTGVETGVTVNVGISATVSGTGSPVDSAGISIGSGTVNTSNGATVTGDRFGIRADTGTINNNAGATISGPTGIEIVNGGSSVFNAGTINGTPFAIAFGGTGNTLTLAASSVITGAVFSTGSGGNTLQLGGAAGTFNMDALDTQYSGFSTFNKIDGALWTLTGTTAFFAGALNVNAGTLRVQAGMNSVTAISVAGGATLDLDGVLTHSVRNLTGAGTVATGPGTLALSGTSNFSGSITGASALNLTGGTTTLSGVNTYSGGTVVNGGALVVGNSQALGSGNLTIRNGSVGYADGVRIDNATTLQNSTTLDVGTGSAAHAGAIGESGGSFGVTKTGAGTLTLSGVNSYTGGTTVVGGTLAIANSQALGTGLLTILNSSTISYASGSIVANTAAIQDPSATFNVASGSATQAGGISESGGFVASIIKAGAGTLILGGANTYTGQTIVQGGALRIGAAAALGANDLVFTGDATVAADSTRTLPNAIVVQAGVSATLSAAAQTTLTLDSSTALFLGLGSSMIFGSATDTGTVVLAQNNVPVGIDGTFEVVGGTVRFGSAPVSSLADHAAVSKVDSGATLDLNSFSTHLNNLTGAGTVAIGGGSLFLSGTSNFAGAITGTGSLTSVSGTTTLSGNNTFSGGSTLNSGTLVLASSQALGSGDLFVQSGTVRYGSAVTIANTIFITNNATFDVQTGAATQAGSIASNGGSFAITKTGAGTLTLKASNALSGTTLDGGTLVLANNRALGPSGALTVLNGTVSYGSDASTGIIIRIDNAIDLHNRTTLDVGSGTARQNGAIGETGGSFGFTKTGAGTLTLFGANTYTGGTTVAAGILRIGTGALGAGVMAFTGDGAFGVDSTRALTNNISIGNGVSGTLGAAPGQTLTLNGASLVVGTGSTIRFGSSADRGTVVLAQAAVTVAAGGTFEVVRGILQAGSPGLLSSFTSHAAATKVGTGATLDLNGFATVVNNLSGNGTVATGGGALSLSGTGNFSGVINGAGTLSFSGTTVLTGTSTYTGASTLGGGTLSVDGSIASSNLTVNSGGTLGGNGTVGNTAINAGAALAPGNSIGLLTVQGNLAFASASSYMVEVSPANADRVNVTGLATLGGAAIKPSFAAGAYVGKQYTILHADGGVSGTFGTEIDTNLPANFHTALSYDANNAYLNLILTFGIPGGLNVTQQNVGDALTNFFNSTGGIPAAFASLSAASLTQVSGQSATGAQQATFGAMNLFMGLISDPFIEGRGETAAGAAGFASEHDGANAYAASTRPRSGSERDAYAAMHRKAPLVETLAQRWSVWAAGFGGSQTTDGNAALGSNSATSRVFGTAAGADYRFLPRTIGGFALAGGGTTFSVANGGWGRSDLFQAGAFIRHTAGSAYLSGALAYGWQDITADRTLIVDGIDRLRAEFKANAVSGRAEGGYRFIAPVAGGVLGVTPYAAAQVTSFGLPAYAESVISGAGTFALAYGSRSVTDTRSELGLRTDKSYAMPNALLTLRSRVAWSHDYNPDRSIAATFQALPGSSFVVNGASQGSDAALTTASAELKWINGWSATATFEGEFSNATRSYAGKGAVRYAW